jgi:hypothetical protein
MPAYDPKTVENFAAEAYQKGCNVEVIIAKYEQNLRIRNTTAFHHNIMLKSKKKKKGLFDLIFGEKKKSLCDLMSLNGFNENETKAFKEAAEAVKQISKYGIKVTLQKKEVGYSWWLDKPILNKPITSKP